MIGVAFPHQFVPQRTFRTAVMLAESDGSDPRRFLGPGPFLVHPHSLRWYTERLALGRMREHFGMLDA